MANKKEDMGNIMNSLLGMQRYTPKGHDAIDMLIDLDTAIKMQKESGKIASTMSVARQSLYKKEEEGLRESRQLWSEKNKDWVHEVLEQMQQDMLMKQLLQEEQNPNYIPHGYSEEEGLG